MEDGGLDGRCRIKDNARLTFCSSTKDEACQGVVLHSIYNI